MNIFVCVCVYVYVCVCVCVCVCVRACVCVCIDTQRALLAVERLQERLKKRGELPAEEKLSLLRSVLQSPLFHQILNMQEPGQQHEQKQVRHHHHHHHYHRASQKKAYNTKRFLNSGLYLLCYI